MSLLVLNKVGAGQKLTVQCHTPADTRSDPGLQMSLLRMSILFTYCVLGLAEEPLQEEQQPEIMAFPWEDSGMQARCILAWAGTIADLEKEAPKGLEPGTLITTLVF